MVRLKPQNPLWTAACAIRAAGAGAMTQIREVGVVLRRSRVENNPWIDHVDARGGALLDEAPQTPAWSKLGVAGRARNFLRMVGVHRTASLGDRQLPGQSHRGRAPALGGVKQADGGQEPERRHRRSNRR